MQLAGRIGVVFGQRSQLWWDLPLRDSFDLLRHVSRVDAARHAANLDRYVGGLDLGPLLDVPNGTERTLIVDLVKPGPPLDVAGATVTNVDGPRQWLRFRRHEVTASELLVRVSKLAEVRDLTIEEPDIESIVREIYTR